MTGQELGEGTGCIPHMCDRISKRVRVTPTGNACAPHNCTHDMADCGSAPCAGRRSKNMRIVDSVVVPEL